MARSQFQKLKLLYLYQFLLKNTDENHSVTINEIIDHLADNDISAERKSLYDDIEMLRFFGVDIEKNKSKTTGYYIASRDFELPELKLLVDLVQSSKFLNSDRSLKLINKLEGLCSKHDAASLQAHVKVQNSIKNTNEYNVYYNVDAIYNAILNNKNIEFLYYKYNARKKKEYRRNEGFHKVSPIELMWDNENYYLICLDCEYNQIRQYRVDRIEKIRLLDESRMSLTEIDKNRISKFETSLFSMFGGEFETVKLIFDDALAGVAIDRFGSDVMMINNNNGTFTINCEVAVSSQFFGWIAGLGKQVKIESPENVKTQYRNFLKECLANYGEEI